MALFVIFKAVLVGALYGGIIFALVSAKNEPETSEVSQEQLNSQGEATLKKPSGKFISAVKMTIKFIYTCLIVMGLFILPFVILRIIL
jgi:hypothetical protein